MIKIFKNVICRRISYCPFKLQKLALEPKDNNNDSALQSPLEILKLKTKSGKLQTSLKKPYRDSFMNVIFTGSCDTDLLLYPEIEKEYKGPLKFMNFEINKNFKYNESTSRFSCDLKTLHGLVLPLEAGGQNLPSTAVAKLAETLSFDLVNAYNILLHNYCIKHALIDCNNSHILNLLPELSKGKQVLTLALAEPEMHSDISNIITTAVVETTQDGNTQYTINGIKSWVTNAQNSNLIITFAKLLPKMGQNADKEDSLTNYAAFLIDKSTINSNNTQQLHIHNHYNLFGLDGLNVCDITFNNLVLDSRNVISLDAFKLAHDLQACLRFSTSLLYQGFIKKCLDQLIDKCNHTKWFDRNMCEYAKTQELIGKLTTFSYAIESITYLVASFRDDYTQYDTYMEDTLLRIFTSNFANECIEAMIQLNGRDSYKAESPLLKTFKDFRILQHLEGSVDDMKMEVALRGIKYYGLAKYGNEVFKDRRFWLYADNIGPSLRRWLRLELAPHWDAFVPRVTPDRRLLSDFVHHSFEKPALQLQLAIAEFTMLIRRAIMTHAKEITVHQSLLIDIGEYASIILAMAAVIGRASRARSLGLKNADTDLTIALSFSEYTKKKTDKYIEDIGQKGEESHETTRFAKIGRECLKQNEYVPTHPLERNWN